MTEAPNWFFVMNQIQVNGCIMLHLDMWWQPQTVDLCC